ncbi:MAG: DALR domain-containing protein [Candidatus Binatia bacterium]
MDDDFNTPRALALIFDEVRAVNRLLDQKYAKGIEERSSALRVMCGTLGLLQPGYFERKKVRFLTNSPIKQHEIEDFIFRRDQARQHKNWREADRLRDELAQKGILLEDTPKGTVWKVK